MAIVKFRKTDLMDIVMSIQYPNKSDNEGYSKAILFQRREDMFDVFVKNSIFRYTTSISPIGEAGSSETPFVLDLKTLTFLIKKIKGDTITFSLEKNGKIVVCVSDGTVFLENYRRMAEKLLDAVFWKPREYLFLEGDLDSLLRCLSLLQRTSVFSIYSEYKKGGVRKNKFYAWYGSILVMMENVNVPDVTLRTSDIPTMRKFIGSCRGPFGLQSLLKDYVLCVGKRKMSFPLTYSDNIVSACTKSALEANTLFSISFGEFRDCLSVVVGLVNPFDTVTLKNQCRKVVVESNTKTGRSVSFALADIEEDEKFSLGISSDFLKKFLGAMGGLLETDDILHVKKDSLGRVYFVSKDISVIIGAKV